MADITEILRQLAYYQAGGGKPSTAEEFGKFLTGTGQALGTAAKGFETGLELQKKRRELSPLSAILKNVPEDYSNLTIGEAKDFAPFIRALRGTPDIQITPAQQQILGTDQSRLSPSQLKADVAIAGLQNKKEEVPVITEQSAYEIGKRGGSLPKGAKIVKDPSALSGFGKAYIEARKEILLPDIIMKQLPSERPSSDPSNAASNIQLASRQLKGLIAAPGSYQRLGLSKGDVARMVLRAAPQEEVLRSAGFSDTLINHLNVIKQRFTSDPTAIDQPEIRKELYDISVELETTSKPIIGRQLNTIETMYGSLLPKGWDSVKKDQLGEGFPDIPFQLETKKKANRVGIAIDSNGNKARVEFDENGKIKKVLNEIR